MLETKINFNIDKQEYILFIEKRFFSKKYYLFRKRTGNPLMKEISIKEIRNSTLLEDFKYCYTLIKGLLIQEKKLNERGKESSN